MDIRRFAIHLLTLYTLTSCDHKDPSEEAILSDVFPQLVDSIGIGLTNMIPTPPPEIYHTDSNFVGFDTIAGNEILDLRRKAIEAIDKIDSRLLIGLVDSCFSLNTTDLIGRADFESVSILDHFQNLETPNNIPRRLDLSSISLGENYDIRYQSDLEKQYDNVWEITDRKFGGFIAISKVYFSKDLKFGLLQFGTNPFHGEGAEYYVLIEHTDSGWRVKRIITNWIT